MEPINATEADLTAYREEYGKTTPVAGAKGKLKDAGRMVRNYLQWCIYDPNDTAHLAAIIEAICTQASTWADADIDPATEGLKPNVSTVQSASLNGGAFVNAGASVMARRRNAASESLTAAAIAVLTDASIFPAQVRVVG